MRRRSLALVFCSLLFSFFFFRSYADEQPSKKTICLNMIVKNESKVIKRCLESAKPIIDYWVIVDTGSTDGTQQIIKDFMKEIPGELHERPWVNFGHNRTEAIKLAKNKADYVLFIDADEVFEITPFLFKQNKLEKDLYFALTEYSGMNYFRPQLAKNDLNWEWKGVVHETLDSPDLKTKGVLFGIKDIVNTDGARSTDPQKFQKDAKLLEEALAKDPTDTRNAFYLAQSYRDAGDNANALEAYKRRVAMGGWEEEIFWSKLQIAHLQKALGMTPETYLASYQEAYDYRPARAEPLYYLANYYRTKENYEKGYEFASKGAKTPLPTRDVLFVDRWIYEYGLPLEVAFSGYELGNYEECIGICQKALAKKLPEEVKASAEEFLGFSKARLFVFYRDSVVQASHESNTVSAIKN